MRVTYSDFWRKKLKNAFAENKDFLFGEEIYKLYK